MKIVVWSFLVLFCAVFTSYSQTKTIEKGTYLSTNKGQKIKLNLLDNNKYELVFYAGEYEIKGDSLLFKRPERLSDVFDLTFSKDKTIKSKKVKVKFLDAFYSFYLGLQKANEDVVYKKIKIDYDLNPNKIDVEVEVDRADFIYLVYEGHDGKSSVSKYSLPKDINNVVVKYSPDLMGDLNVQGHFNSKTSELTVGDKNGKNPLVFQSEKEINNLVPNSRIIPLESLIIPNWTYPGKDPLLVDDFGAATAVDTVSRNGNWDVPPPPPPSDKSSKRFDFKINVENSLKKAIEVTKKESNKFLVVYNDFKNQSAKSDFDAFIKEEEIVVGYNFYDEYKPEFDRFNFYLSSDNDKKWLKNNKIEDNSTIVILNSNGNVLATAKSKLIDKSYQFNYYDPLCKNLDRANVFLDFKNIISDKKINDTNLILAFNRVVKLDVPYETDSYYSKNSNQEDFKINYDKFDKKQIYQVWNDLIVRHQKDTKPNLYLVEVILKEIKNQGFTKQFFNEEKVLNETDFIAIDYLIKHIEAIENEKKEFNNTKKETFLIGNISSEISNTLSQNYYLATDTDFTKEKLNQEKVMSVYKKLIAKGQGNYDFYMDYLNYLKMETSLENINTNYLKEFDVFFNNYLSPEKGNVFEQLNILYGSADETSDGYGYYSGWNAFKGYCANACNESAWSVVENVENADYLKKAIAWSEYSLIINKENAYYLDTLAQLYYKDGQKEKAIKTQKEAIKYSTEIEEETAAELKEVLIKMENGTY